MLRCTCRNSEYVGIRPVGYVLGDSSLHAKLIGGARATGVKVRDGQVVVALEADVVVEMTALTRLWIKAYEADDEALDELDESGSDSDSDSSSESESETESETEDSSSSSTGE